MGNTDTKPALASAHLTEAHRVTRIWRVPLHPSPNNSSSASQVAFRNGMQKPESSWVVLRQEEEIGQCRVYVDGTHVLEFQETKDSATTISKQFTLTDGQLGEIHVRRNNSWVDYTWKLGYHLFVNGKDCAELNEFHPAKPSPPPFFTGAVVAYQVSKSLQGEEYVRYEIVVTANGKPQTILRRYRDFCMLDLCLRWSWRHHLQFSLDTLPKIPERRSKAALDRMNHEFILHRQQKLEIYIKQVLKLPRAEENPDVLAFFDLVQSLDDICFCKESQNIGGDASAAGIASEKKSTQLGTDGPNVENTSELVQNNTPLDEFDEMLVSASQGQIDSLLSESSYNSRECISKLVLSQSLELILKGVFKTASVKPLIRGFKQTIGNRAITENEFQSWCDSQLPSLPDILRDRMQQIVKQIFPKRPFPPQIDSKALILDDSSVKFCSVAFTECYNTPVWNRLFASFHDGLSFQTLATAIEGYEGPTLIVLQDAFGCKFGALATSKWREDTGFFSSTSGALFSLAPMFAVYRRLPVNAKTKSKNVQYMNSRSRTLPLGLGFGGDLHSKNAGENAPHPRLWIDAEFETCFATSGSNDLVYEPGPLLGDDLLRQTFHVAHIEVWGLGGDEGMRGRDAWRIQKERMLMKQRQVDKSQFANNAFDREFLLNSTFSGNKRETNDN